MASVSWSERHALQRQLYEAVSEYVRLGYNQAIKEKKTYVGFLLLLMQRLVTSSTRAILPPPALTVSMRMEGSASGMPATAPAASCTAAPPVTRLASALVPPMSRVKSSESPTAAPTSRAPTTPPAGPDSASAAVRQAAAAGASVPPADVMIRSAATPRERASRSSPAK